MPIVKHTRVEASLSQTFDAGQMRFILAAGEDFLVQETFDLIKKKLLPKDAGSFHLEVLDGRSTPMGDIIEQVTTFSFLGGSKIIAVKQVPIFSTKAGAGEILYSEQDLLRLSDLVETGIPEGHFLVMTASSLDRRRKIFKTLEKTGLIIDCTVSRGAGKADQDDQRSVRWRIQETVQAFWKQMCRPSSSGTKKILFSA